MSMSSPLGERLNDSYCIGAHARVRESTSPNCGNQLQYYQTRLPNRFMLDLKLCSQGILNVPYSVLYIIPSTSVHQ
jgi:hypothetical protein